MDGWTRVLPVLMTGSITAVSLAAIAAIGLVLLVVALACFGVGIALGVLTHANIRGR